MFVFGNQNLSIYTLTPINDSKRQPRHDCVCECVSVCATVKTRTTLCDAIAHAKKSR